MKQNKSTTCAVVEGLRRWASGGYALEAGVELLARSFGGRLADPGWSWIATEDGRSGRCWWVDAESDADAGVLSGGERRVLSVVFSLVADCPVVVSDLAGLDRPHLGLVLAALAHAGGSHEHSDLRFDADGSAAPVFLPPLFGWPGTDTGTCADDGWAA